MASTNLSPPTYFQRLQYISAFAIFLLAHIPLGPIWLAIYILRNIARITSLCKRNFGRILLWQDMVLFENYHVPHRGSFCIYMKLQGHLPTAEVKSLFEKNVFGAKLQNGKNRFPELKQYQSTWLGFRFWKQDLNFDLDTHIEEILFEGGFKNGWDSPEQIFNSLICLPFLGKKSPWKLFVLQIPDPEGYLNTTLVFRTNHTVCDAHGVIAIFFECLGGSMVVTPKAKTLSVKNSRFSWILTPFKVLQGLYNLQKPFWRNRDFRRDLSNEKKFMVKVSSQIPIKVVKQLAKKFNSRVPTILMTLVAEALSEIFLEAEGDQTIFSTYAVPRPDHPGTMTNHVKMGVVEIPIGGKIDIRKRIKIINESFLQVPTNGITDGLDYVGYLAGSMFPWMTILSRGMNYAPLSITNFCFGANQITIGGKECVSFVPSLTTYKDVQGLFALAASYKDEVTFIFDADNSFLSEEEMGRLNDEIISALQTLQSIEGEPHDCLLDV